MHWGWCLFIELNILCTHDASKILFVTLVKCPFGPGHKNFLCADIPQYCKAGFLLPNQTLPLQRTLLECLSRKGNSLMHTSAQRGRGRTLPSLTQWQENFMWERGKGVFPVPQGIGVGVHLGRWMSKATTLLPNPCFLEFLWLPFCHVCMN